MHREFVIVSEGIKYLTEHRKYQKVDGQACLMTLPSDYVSETERPLESSSDASLSLSHISATE